MQLRGFVPSAWKNGLVKSIAPEVWNVSATPKSFPSAASAALSSSIGSLISPSTPHPASESRRPPDTTLSDLNIEDLQLSENDSLTTSLIGNQ